jgi:hypothetical protein
VDSKFCPKCGAYWQCDCVIEVVEDEVLLRPSEIEKLQIPIQPGCEHDWSEALGVEVDEDLVPGEAQVMVCRLCGIYSVEERSA